MPTNQKRKEITKAEIEKFGHSVTNIWNIKQYTTKLPDFMFFAELQPARNKKNILNVDQTVHKRRLENTQMCKLPKESSCQLQRM
jgi:hypothetical protein